MHPDRVGPYRLVEHLGSGGMGEVYRAYDERLKRWVAIKQIRLSAEDPLRHQRFRREAQATAVLNHPTIVQIYDVLETDDGEWIVMEYVEGKTVATSLIEGPLPMKRGLGIARQVASGLAEAHSRGILHRDLKTENIMVTPEGKVKILDFGLAKKLFGLKGYDLTEPDTWKSVSGKIVGTSRAMSPEQAKGDPLDFRSDLFSLGTLYFEMLTGVSPFKGFSHIDTLNRVCTYHQSRAHEINPEIPRPLSRLIDRLLEKDPDRRPQNVGEVLEALDTILGDEREISTSFEVLAEPKPPPTFASVPVSDPTRPGRPLPPGERRPGRLSHEEVTRPFWRRFALPPALEGILDSLQFLRGDSSESFD